MRRRGFVAVALALVAAASAARADGYDEALAAARREASAGRWESAARLLEGPARSWPQDYPMQLERAWCLFQAGDHGRAAAAYEQARALAPDAVEPVLGLAWTAHRQADAARARRLFGEVLRRDPANASAREGLALLGDASRGSLSLSGAYTGHGQSSKPWLASAGVALDGLLADRLTLGGLYRVVGTQSTFSGSASRGRGASSSAAPQHELHGALGWAGAGWNASIHGGWISESATQSGAVRTIWAEQGTLAGASAGLRPGTWLELDASGLRTFYPSGDVTQLQATAGVVLGRGLVLRGGARGQRSAAGNGLAGLLGLEWRGSWSAWLAAEVGAQRRPVDLLARAIYAVPEELLWAGRSGVTFPLGGAWSGHAALDLESWRGAASTGSTDSLAWRGSAGLRLAF